MSKKPKQAKRYRHRSAITGRYVTAAYAKRYPHTTWRERVRVQSR